MKQPLRLIISASAASVLALSALAQDTPAPQTGEPAGPSASRTPHARRADQLNGAAKASDILGMSVSNYQNEKLGRVEEVALDVESGRIVHVVLSTGGFLGLGDARTAVPPGALHHDVASKVLHLDADQAKLKGAPTFEMSNWAECCDSSYLARVYHHYGEDQAFQVIQGAEVRPNDPRHPEVAPEGTTARKPDRTPGQDRQPGASVSTLPVWRFSHLQKASTLIGTSVENLQNEKLGTVDNLLLDLASGRIVAVIVSSGGFLGLGDERSAIPPTALRFASDRTTLQLDASKEQLSRAPHFKADQWPDFAQPRYADGVYRAYSVEPYFTPDVIPAADNTARNVRDRTGQTLTPLDQGNRQADVNITAQIRKEIVAGKDLSVNARNVKIITLDGRVTLRGPVDTAEEKRLIGAIADRIVRSENVDNQLEVTATTSSVN